MSNPMDQVPRPAPKQAPVAQQPPKPRQLAPRQTRKPSGKPSWPVLLLTGREKTGKSFQAARASASPLIGDTYWVGFGEKDPDEYGAIPGARFEIVAHDGTMPDFYDAIRWAAAQQHEGGMKNLLVIDSGTRVWDTLRDEATAAAIARKAFDRNGEPIVGMDLWNKATARWNKILEAARSHDGPVIITARLDTVTVIGGDGKPTKEKTDKIKGQRNLAYDVDAIIEMPERGKATLAGARSVLYQVPDRASIDWFEELGVDGLWRKLGLDTAELAAPVYTEPVNNEAI